MQGLVRCNDCQSKEVAETCIRVPVKGQAAQSIELPYAKT